MFNAAHLHLFAGHFVVALLPVGSLLAFWGARKNDYSLIRTGQLLLALGAASGIAVFLSGEGAEEIIEHATGAVTHAIEPHEEAGEVAVWALGATLLFQGIPLLVRTISVKTSGIVAGALGLLTSVVVLYTAMEGGEIRHPEVTSEVNN